MGTRARTVTYGVALTLHRSGIRLYVSGEQNEKRPFCMRYREMANGTERSSQRFKISAWLFPKYVRLADTGSHMSTPLVGTLLTRGTSPLLWSVGIGEDMHSRSQTPVRSPRRGRFRSGDLSSCSVFLSESYGRALAGQLAGRAEAERGRLAGSGTPFGGRRR